MELWDIGIVFGLLAVAALVLRLGVLLLWEYWS
jgi:hypothetical protein